MYFYIIYFFDYGLFERGQTFVNLSPVIGTVPGSWRVFLKVCWLERNVWMSFVSSLFYNHLRLIPATLCTGNMIIIFSKPLKKIWINVGVWSITVALQGLKCCCLVHHYIHMPSTVPGIYMLRERGRLSRTNRALSGPYSINQKWKFRGRNEGIINKEQMMLWSSHHGSEVNEPD